MSQMSSPILQKAKLLCDQFLSYINKSITPFHAIYEAKLILLANNFTQLSESENWELKRGGKYFFTRNMSTLIAFTVGLKYDPNKTGFKIIGTHTDSPCIRLAPNYNCSNQDIQQLNVTLYGGGLWHTWFDRDLTIGGRIIYKEQQTNVIDSCLFNANRAIAKIPSLAIHLRQGEDSISFRFNEELHIKPIIADEIYKQLLKKTNLNEQFVDNNKKNNNQKQENQNIQLLNEIAQQLNMITENIIDFDLFLADHQPAQYFGLNDQFISSPRIDNLFSTFIALKSFVNIDSVNIENSNFINMICLFDNEEIGCQSFQGAKSSLLQQVMKRIFTVLNSEINSTENHTVFIDSEYKMFSNSFFISADSAHCIHPNYPECHNINSKIMINKGPVIKFNFNQQFATDSISSAIIKILGERLDIPLQQFIMKNDHQRGFTLGPFIAANTGIKVVDVGCVQLGMHSIRETCGVIDAYYYEQLFTGFFKYYEEIKHSLLKF